MKIKEEIQEEKHKAQFKIDNWAIVDKRLYLFLHLHTEGAALTFVESAKGKGFEAWRRLHEEYDPLSTQKTFSKMGTLMGPSRAEGDKDVSAAIESWEREYREYTEHTLNDFPEYMRIEIMLNLLPKKMEMHFRTFGR